jgi:hypothetical protein
MKYLLLTLTLLSTICFGQNNNSKSNDFDRIRITVLDCQNIEGMSSISNNMVLNKVNALLLKNSLGGSYGSRFILIPNIVIESKSILSTAPVKHVYVISLNLYIGDGIDGTLFSNVSVRLKGVGDSETKAYIDAFNNFDINSDNLKNFIVEGKNKIIQFYNAQCDILISEAKSNSAQNNFDLALNQLSSIPDVCLDCFNKVQPVILEIYGKKINSECKTLLLNAKSAWVNSQNITGANQASEYLKNINPNSNCYNDALIFSNEVSNRLKEIDNREWSYKLKQQQDQVDINKEIIKAARDIGVAYGQNQPKTISYNYILWW